MFNYCCEVVQQSELIFDLCVTNALRIIKRFCFFFWEEYSGTLHSFCFSQVSPPPTKTKFNFIFYCTVLFDSYYILVSEIFKLSFPSDRRGR
uniref:Ovule protein n=1 Tax=Parascaris univalens TaxID=6257 RepID=A0A915AKM4_PARUN